MRIEKSHSEEIPLAVQVSALIGVPCQNIMVSKSPDIIEVKLRNSNGDFKKDIPKNKQKAVRTWAENLLGL